MPLMEMGIRVTETAGDDVHHDLRSGRRRVGDFVADDGGVEFHDLVGAHRSSPIGFLVGGEGALAAHGSYRQSLVCDPIEGETKTGRLLWPEGRLEAVLRSIPVRSGFGDLRDPGVGDGDTCRAPVVGVDGNREKALALERPQIVADRGAVHRQQLAEDGHTQGTAMLEIPKYRELTR